MERQKHVAMSTLSNDAVEHRIRRILVALDASPHSEVALETAASMAAFFEAELHGVFVEDIDLLRSADLSIAREVHSFVLPAQAMSRRRLHRQLQRQAEQAEAALVRAARRAEVAHAFTVARGRVADELLEAAAEADLITLGKASTARCSRHKLGRTARALLQRAPSSVLVVREALPAQAPLFVYYDDSAAAGRALAFAAALVQQQPARPLTVLLPPGAADEVERLRDAIAQQVGRTVPQLRVRVLGPLEAARLTIVHGEGRSLVVLPATAPPLDEANLQRLLYTLDGPLLVVH